MKNLPLYIYLVPYLNTARNRRRTMMVFNAITTLTIIENIVIKVTQ